MGNLGIKATLNSLIAWSVILFLSLTSSQFHCPEFLCTATLLANWWFLLPINSFFPWFHPPYTNSTSILRPSFLSLSITGIIFILFIQSTHWNIQLVQQAQYWFYMSSSPVQSLVDREGCGLLLNKAIPTSYSASLWFCKKAKLGVTEIRWNVLDIKTWYFSSFGGLWKKIYKYLMEDMYSYCILGLFLDLFSCNLE